MPLLDALALGFAGVTSEVCHHSVEMDTECDACFSEVEELEAEGLL